MMKSVGKHFGLRRKCAPPKSRIDKKKTRVNPIDTMLDDSDEGSFGGSTTSVSSESEYHNSEQDSGTSDSSYRARESDADDSSDTDDRRTVSRRQKKRTASAPPPDEDSSSSSASRLSSSSSSESSSDVGGEPLRRVLQRKRLRLPEDSEDEALKKKKREAEIKEAAAKRRERKNKLMELSKKRKSGTPRRRRRTMGSDDDEEEEDEKKEEVKEVKVEEPSKADSDGDSSVVEENASPLNSSDEEKLAHSSDSMKDFIVEEEQKKDEEQEGDEDAKEKILSQLPRQFITGSQLSHFQLVVKSLLINVLDSTFLKSLYSGERTKRYAQEMKTSLLHFDERMVLPRLENLKQRSRWKDRYKERVECYPKLRVVMTRTQMKGCEACELHRTGRFTVRLSGQLYHCETLQEDTFMPDDSQSFFVGSVCASRTEVYHALKHFKYHLFEKCRKTIETRKEMPEGETGEDDEPVKDTVNKAFTKLQDDGWIKKQYDEFQEHLNAADFFQEEKLD
ncbi:coiled-coil domain-containing protein 82 isoform X2 [Danio aesculapii]|uniref:coiled-coil domain-containing protein 82 isoform X2 n=1 Tax=Danio aesculapii TaxID=1142201 RepID=UPI0024BF4D88|nr:coiled-coil domain-containing protein 82 isoform X2 [Danio aesculapii]